MRIHELAGCLPRRGIVRLHMLAAMAMSLAAVFTWALPGFENGVSSPGTSCRECNVALASQSAEEVLTAAASTAYDEFAAIAYCQSSRRWGYAFNHGTRAGAESAAIARCGDACCEVVVWVENGCAALAVGDEGRYGWSFRYGTNDLSTAMNEAMSQCNSRTTNCRVEAWTCTAR